MNETWFVLEDGTAADPCDVVTGKSGKLEHKDGRKVDYADHGPRSRSVDPAVERAKTFASKTAPLTDPDGNPPSDKAPAADRDIKVEQPKRGYTTRQSRAN